MNSTPGMPLRLATLAYSASFLPRKAKGPGRTHRPLPVALFHFSLLMPSNRKPRASGRKPVPRKGSVPKDYLKREHLTRDQGLAPSQNAVSYTHLTLPTTPYV